MITSVSLVNIHHSIWIAYGETLPDLLWANESTQRCSLQSCCTPTPAHCTFHCQVYTWWTPLPNASTPNAPIPGNHKFVTFFYQVIYLFILVDSTWKYDHDLSLSVCLIMPLRSIHAITDGRMSFMAEYHIETHVHAYHTFFIHLLTGTQTATVSWLL